MEFVNHLGIGHLGLEPVVIAYHNWKQCFDPRNDVLIKMLGPHMEGTLAINDFSRHTLIDDEDAATDNLLSCGMRLLLLCQFMQR